MTLMDKDRLVLSPVKRLAEVFPENKVTLVLGLPGSGKTTSVLKALKQDGIKPIWFNYDHSDTVIDTSNDVDMFDGEYVPYFINGEIDDIKNRVIVIDTYERMWEQLEFRNMQKEKEFRLTRVELQHSIVTLLEKVSEQNNNTIIVIAHPEEYVGRDGIFKDNPTLARRAYEILSFEKRLSTSIKELKAGNAETNFMYIKKGRCYTGKTTFIDWMRD